MLTCAVRVRTGSSRYLPPSFVKTVLQDNTTRAVEQAAPVALSVHIRSAHRDCVPIAHQEHSRNWKVSRVACSARLGSGQVATRARRSASQPRRHTRPHHPHRVPRCRPHQCVFRVRIFPQMARATEVMARATEVTEAWQFQASGVKLARLGSTAVSTTHSSAALALVGGSKTTPSQCPARYALSGDGRLTARARQNVS